MEWKKRFIFIFLCLNSSSLFAVKNLEIEGGALYPAKFQLSYWNSPNSAKNWDINLIPTGRIEYFSDKSRNLSYGVSAVPLYFERRDVLRQNLAIGGSYFLQGEPTKLYYGFHTLRGTVNYRMVGIEKSYLRLGGTAIARYAEIEMLGIGRGGQEASLGVFPAINWELHLSPSRGSWGFLWKGDALPVSLRTGFYDMFIGARWDFSQNAMDIGIRAIWGGFSPNRLYEPNNEVLFIGPVVRFLIL